MKAIARLVWTYLTAFPILRWVGVVALVSLPFLVLAIWSGAPGFMALPFIAFAIHSLSMSIAAGYLFRVVSSPRSHRFLPHFRGRSLAAFVVIVAIVAAPWVVMVPWAAPRGLPLAAALVWPLCMATLMVGLTFSPVATAVTFASLATIRWLLTRLMSAYPEFFATPRVGDLTPMAGAVFLIGAWATFSIWYLRARRIEPLQSVAMILDRIGIRPSAGSVVFDRASAMTATLAATYPRDAKQLGVWVALLILGTKVAADLAKDAHLPGTTVFFVPALTLPGVLVAAVATRLARRTRSLWLKSGLSRRGLLAATEKQVWRTAASRSIALSVVLATGIALAYDVPVPVLERGLASAVATATLAVYLGVAHVRDSRLIEACTAALVVASAAVGVWAALSAPARDGLWLATIVIQIAAALVLRAVAISQWRSIDWLVFKPIRIWSRSLRS
jgi:hypothetical protein